jgi:hypothetical protein
MALTQEQIEEIAIEMVGVAIDNYTDDINNLGDYTQSGYGIEDRDESELERIRHALWDIQMAFDSAHATPANVRRALHLLRTGTVPE